MSNSRYLEKIEQETSQVDMPGMNSKTAFTVYSYIFFKCWKSICQHAYLHFLKEFNSDPIHNLFIYLFFNSQMSW